MARRDEHVLVAVEVEVRDGGAAPDFGLHEGGAQACCDILEALARDVAE